MAGDLRLSAAALSDMSNIVKDIVIAPKHTEGATGQEETTYQNSKWPNYWGYFNAIPELKSAIIMKAIWNVGKGYEADPETTVILDHISGWGKDTFEDILFNMEIVRRVGGDAFSEIIRDEDTGIILNLKPLDPGTIKTIVDKKGILKRYEQISKISDKNILFEPEDIFHLSNNRIADQIHGISEIESLEPTILAENENFVDMKKIMHRQAKPMIMFKLGTDDPAKIAAFIAKMDNAVNKGENIYIPDDINSVSYEVVQVNVSQSIVEWRNNLTNKFYRAMGLPLILFGQAGSTESGGKIEYLAHENVFEHDQRFIENQIWQQLNLRIDLVPPTSLLENLQKDQGKDGEGLIGAQPSDITAGEGR